MKILVVDDHPMFRRGVREILEAWPEVESIMEADNGATAIRHIELMAPEFAIIDLALPDVDGLELMAWVCEHAAATRCIVLTMYDEQRYLERALELGACGYLLKDDTEGELRHCLETALNDETYVSPRFGRPRRRLYPLKDAAVEARLATLSAMQKAVLARVAEFKTSKEIADELGISFRTVQNHRNAIATQLQLSGPNQLLRFASRYVADD